MRAIALLLAIVFLTSCAHSGAADVQQTAVSQRVTLYRQQAAEIVTLELGEYIEGCLFGELSPSCHEEALKAAAVVIAGNALYQLQNGDKHCGADYSDSAMRYISPEEAALQHGSSYGYYLDKVRSAAEYGMANALTYEGEQVYAPYCAFSTGRTERGGEPWLPSVEVYADKDCEQGASSSAWSDTQVMRRLGAVTGVSALPARREEWFSDAEYTEGGTLRYIRFGGALLTGAQLREVFGLRSAAVTVEYSEERFVFRVRGSGDDLGMSLNGAAAMAKGGTTAEQILAYFYPHTVLMPR